MHLFIRTVTCLDTISYLIQSVFLIGEPNARRPETLSGVESLEVERILW